MGTRNLTIVKIKSKTKVAQYGQWDGYPTGQGQTIADFLKTVDLEKFKEQISKLKEYTKKDIKKVQQKLDDAINKDKIMKQFPELDRDYGAGILQLIHDGVVTKVKLNEDFKKDTLFCEYCYTIDLDKETVQVGNLKPFTFKQWTRKGLMKKLEKQDV